MNTHKHLTFDDRCKIHQLLAQHVSFRQIALELDKDPSTISKEIRNHLQFKKIGSQGKAFNDCSHRTDCWGQKLCGDQTCRRYCKYCYQKSCRTCCSEYQCETCRNLSKPPYVCNGCTAKNKCTLEKRVYDAKFAQQEYEATLSESRKGIQATEEEICRLDGIITPLLRQGQSLHHICISNRDLIMQHERTMYNWVDDCILQARNIDMPRRVRFGVRKPKKDNFKVDRQCRLNRTLEDYLAYQNENPGLPIVEMDSVEGIKGGKVLLTIHFKTPEFMLAFLRDANTSQSAIDCFDFLENLLGFAAFQRLFPALLGDNGSEFSNPTRIETSLSGALRTRVFYCDPASPYQRGSQENNHSLLRRVAPKGTSFNDWTQEMVDVMMNQVNSYRRDNLGNVSPYEMFSLIYGEQILKALGAKLIPPGDIILRPTLFK